MKTIPLALPLICLLLVLSVPWLGAADYYVRAGATGNNNGTDWTHAWTALPTTLERGSTYYIASGTYAPYVFDDPESGDQFITIKKAMPDDHGSSVGWSDTFAGGQAVFTASEGPIFSFRRGYFRIDGQSGEADSGHGIKLLNPANIAAHAGGSCVEIPSGVVASNLTLEHLEMESGGWAGTVVPSITRAIYAAGKVGDFVLRSCYIHHAGQLWVQFADPEPNFLIENCYFSKGGSGDSNYHSVGIWIRESKPNMNIVIRNNVFQDFAAAGGTGYLSLGWRPTRETQTYSSGYEIYGNIFRETSPLAGPSRAIGSNSSNGGAIISNVKIFNNTFHGLKGSSGGRITLANPGENNFASNNIWYGCEAPPLFVNIEETSNIKNTGNNPFVDPHSLRLAGPLPGILIEGDAIDPAGAVRGADGVWDIGAFEYVSNGTNQPPILSPIGPKSTPAGQQLQFQVHATDADGDPLIFSATGP
jgi:hypothetical protein